MANPCLKDIFFYNEVVKEGILLEWNMERQHNMQGLISDNGFPAPTEEELRNIFAASCVEAAARETGCTAAEMYRQMKEANLFAELIYPCYETLHTQSRRIVTEDILNALRTRQKRTAS